MLLRVKSFAKVPHPQHYYNDECLTKERFCLGLFGSLEAEATVYISEWPGAVEMFGEHLGIGYHVSETSRDIRDVQNKGTIIAQNLLLSMFLSFVSSIGSLLERC